MKRERDINCERCGEASDNLKTCERCDSVSCIECHEYAEPKTGFCVFCNDAKKLKTTNKVKCGNCDDIFLEEVCIQCTCRAWYCKDCTEPDYDGTLVIWIVDGRKYCKECEDDNSRCCDTWILHIGNCNPEYCILITKGQDTGKELMEKGRCCFVARKEPCRYCINSNNINTDEDDDEYVNIETNGWGPILVKAGDETVICVYGARRCGWSVNNQDCLNRLLNGDKSFLLEAYNSAGRWFGISTNEESEWELVVLRHGYDTCSIESSDETSFKLAVGNGRPVLFTKKESGNTTLNMIPAPCVFQIASGTECEYLRVEEDAFEKVFLPLCPDQTKNTQQKADWLWESREVIKTKIPNDYLSKFETWCKPHIFWQKK